MHVTPLFVIFCSTSNGLFFCDFYEKNALALEVFLIIVEHEKNIIFAYFLKKND